MKFGITLRVVGLLLMVFSATMLPPLFVSWIYADGTHEVFMNAFLFTLASGALLWLPFRNQNRDLRTKDGFIITVCFYLALGTFGAIPLLEPGGIDMGWIDALFESFSGLTTTGATVITGIDDLPQAILFYRQQLQWLGGMGIIVLAVAILPMLGIGGMQLYRIETPGPMKDSKLTPRIKQTALALWSIYIGITVACAGAYWIAGMSLFDAICHAFSTVAIGGFSTHDASIGFFDSPAVEAVAIVFMVIAGINFSLHFLSWQQRSLMHYLRDEEARFYLILLAVSALGATGLLAAHGVYPLPEAFRRATFEVVSIFTTTGFAIDDFSAWPNLLPFFIFFGAFMGACAGSTGGGMKVMRVLLIWKQGAREIYRLIHPNAVFPIKMNRRPVSNSVIEAVWGFFAVYVIGFLTMLMALLATGLDFLTAFSAMGACINNLGPGLGEVAQHYGDLNPAAKLILTAAMILGRLEIFTLLVLLSPMFWRK